MEMFKPNLSLGQEPNGTFTLASVTLVPNSSYSALPARLGIPANVKLTSEVLSVILPVRARKGISLPVLTPIFHRLPGQKLGGDSGKSSVIAFFMLGDTILGSASIDLASAMPIPDPGVAPIETADWYAWVNRMPPGPASFHVVGTVRLPDPGFECELVPASPQGINPAELILDLKVKRRPGIWPHHVVSTSVRHDVAPYGAHYSNVLVRVPGGDDPHIPVEDAV